MKRMNHQWMRCACGIALAIAALGGAGCGSDEASSATEQLDPFTGSVRLPLVTPTRDQFRLRGASFDIERPGFELTLDSDSDPDATALTAALDTGSYQITLRDGWSLERLGDAGGPVAAALLTENPLSFDIQNGRVTELLYRFATESGIVTFGSGELSISVDVTDSAPSASCSLVGAFGCAEGQTCLFSGEQGQTFCAVPGALRVGEACSSDQCVAGAQCLALDPANPGARTCTRFCAPSVQSPGCDCRALAFDDDVGVCVPRAACTGPDCPVDVLIAAADAQFFVEDVQRHLQDTGAFASVDVFNANIGTPSLEELANYDAVLVYSDNSFLDANALGDNLADYFDAGGRVVVATFANSNVPLGGRWALDGFQLIDPIGVSIQFEFSPLFLFEPESPLLADVVSLTAQSGYHSGGTLINGGVTVAAWGSGIPLIVRGERDGRARAELNFFPPSSQVSSDFWVGSGAEIMRNALLFQ